ncbi:hypothetical protein F4804DRAFT_353418 [Jackrogersella minutella]|nr:hypothetical protein F4804DRAFT_353418 [Jackrogersella minutella]
MFQLPVTGPNQFLREEQIIAAGSRDAYVFPYSFDGTSMSDAQREAKAEAAENCSWRGDSPEPQPDDLAHDEQLRLPDDTCDWKGDPAEPELDDLAHPRSPKLSPKSRSPSRQLSEIEPKPFFTNEKQPSAESKKEQAPGDTGEETLQDKVTHGVQQAFNIFQNIIKTSEQTIERDVEEVIEGEPSEDKKPPAKETEPPPGRTPALTIVEPQPAKGRKTKEDKEKAKKEKAEAKKAQKEKKAQEKEEKKKLKKEKSEAKKGKGKKDKGKGTEFPPPDLPAGANGLAAAEPDQHPGCHICQHPEEEGTLDFMRETLESWQGLPSLDELVVAAKKLLSSKGPSEPQGKQETNQSSSTFNEQELIDHIAAHLDRHIHQYFDLDSPEGGNPEAGKAPPRKLNTSKNQGSTAPGSQQESRENGGATSHGLDGNRDWPMTIMQDHIFRSLEPMSTPDVAAIRSPRDYSPCRVPTSRSVSPWCEQLGLKMEETPRPFPRRNGSWLRRGFNSSPSRVRSLATTSCLHVPVCSHGFYHEPAMYACVPVSLVPSLGLDSPCCGHTSCHYISPIMSPVSVPLTPHSSFTFDPSGISETIPFGAPRRSFSANEIQALF